MLRTNDVRALSLTLPVSTRAVLPWAVGIVAIISYYYLFLASAGRFIDLPGELDYYDQMAEGFRHGHLYIQTQPPPELANSPNPFDSKFYGAWLWDASLYKGHYYMYWGPLPGLGILIYKLLIAHQAHISDQWPTAIFMLGRLFAGAALIVSLASRMRLRQPAWLVCLAIAVFGLANPTPFIVARPHIYEASLAGSQCFVFWGLLWAFWAIERPRMRRFFFALAGISLALAMGCRATVIVAIPLVMVISVAFAWYGSRPSWKERVSDCLAFGVPVGLAGVAYALYNYARFDSFTEFGIHYQVTLQPFFSRSQFVVPNVFAYLFAPVVWTCRFPFAHVVGDRVASSFVHWPPGYQTFERVAGIVPTVWWCWLVVICVYRAGAQLWARTRSVGRSTVPVLTTYEVWTLLCAVAVILTMVPVLSLWEASMRYVEDALGGIVLASTLAAFWLLQRARQPGRRWFAVFAHALVAVLGIQTCVVGALGGFTSYYEPFRTNNPALYQWIENGLSLCKAPSAKS